MTHKESDYDELERMVEEVTSLVVDDCALQFARGITGVHDLTIEQAHEVVHAVCRQAGY